MTSNKSLTEGAVDDVAVNEDDVDDAIGSR